MFFERKIVTFATNLIESQPVAKFLAAGWSVKVHSTHTAVMSTQVLHYTTFVMRRFRPIGWLYSAIGRKAR